MNLYDPSKLSEYTLQKIQSGVIFTSKNDFSEFIESVSAETDTPVFQMLILYTEIIGCEYETVANLLTDNLKEKIKEYIISSGGEFCLKLDESEKFNIQL